MPAWFLFKTAQASKKERKQQKLSHTKMGKIRREDRSATQDFIGDIHPIYSTNSLCLWTPTTPSSGTKRSYSSSTPYTWYQEYQAEQFIIKERKKQQKSNIYLNLAFCSKVSQLHVTNSLCTSLSNSILPISYLKL